MGRNTKCNVEEIHMWLGRNTKSSVEEIHLWLGRNTKSSVEEIHMWLGRNTKSSVEEIHMWLGRDRWAGLDWAARVGLLQLEGFPASVTNNNVIACSLEIIIYYPSKWDITFLLQKLKMLCLLQLDLFSHQ